MIKFNKLLTDTKFLAEGKRSIRMVEPVEVSSTQHIRIYKISSDPTTTMTILASELGAATYERDSCRLALVPEKDAIVCVGSKPQHEIVSKTIKSLAADETDEADPGKKEVDSAKIFRNWTDSAGKFTFEGTVLKVDDKKVVLQDRKGESISVSLEKLSKADRDWVNAATSGKPAKVESEK